MSSVNTQFSIAVHIMTGLAVSDNYQITSGALSESVNASPSFVRRVLAKLSKADLVRTTSGKSGSCTLVRKPSKINLLEIYDAVEAPKAFAIHEYPETKGCRVSCNIKPSLQSVLDRTTKAVESTLKDTSLADVVEGLHKKR